MVLHAQSKLQNNMFLKKLPNGLDVLVVEDNTVPLATLVMTFKAGAFTESQNSSGITALYLNMLAKGNKDYANQEDLDYHEGQLGIQLSNSTTAEEYSRTYFTLPAAELKEGLDFMNTEIRFAKMSPVEFQKEKEIICNEIKSKQSSPSFALSVAMLHHLWGNLYNRKTALGTEESIRAATNTDADSVKTKYFNPNNALLIVGGDVKHDATFALVEKIYGDWTPGGSDPSKKWPIPEFKPLNKSDYYTVESPLSKSPLIEVNWQGPDTRNDIPATYAADIFSYIINQASSKLSVALIQSGLATSFNISYLTLKYRGPITLYIRPNPLKVKECMVEVKKQIELMSQDDYISEEQIATAKRMIEIAKIRQEEITSDYTKTISFWWATASLDYFIGYRDNLQKVSHADIRQYVEKYISKKPYCAGLLLSPELSKQLNPEAFFTSN